MEGRFRGIVAVAVSSAKRQKQIVRIEDAARRQGVPADLSHCSGAIALKPLSLQEEIDKATRMARESGRFFEGLAKAMDSRPLHIDRDIDRGTQEPLRTLSG